MDATPFVTPTSPFQGHVVWQKSNRIPLRTLVLPYMRCIALGEGPHRPGSQFPHPKNREKESCFSLLVGTLSDPGGQGYQGQACTAGPETGLGELRGLWVTDRDKSRGVAATLRAPTLHALCHALPQLHLATDKVLHISAHAPCGVRLAVGCSWPMGDCG